MYKKHHLVLLIAITHLLLSSPNLRAQSENLIQQSDSLYLNIQQTMTLMLEENYTIKAAELEVQVKERQRKEAQGFRYPQIGISANYTMMSDPIKMDLNPIGDALKGIYEAELIDVKFLPEPYSTALTKELSSGLNDLNAAEWDVMIQDYQMGLVSLSFNWVLYSGGKIKAANNAAEAKLEESHHKKDQLSGAQISQLVKTYYGLQLAHEVQFAQREVVSGMDKHLRDANKLFENGMISEAERLHAEVALAGADQRYQKASQRVELLQMALQNLLSTTHIIVPISPLFILEEVPSISSFLEKMELANPLLKQLESKEKLAYEQVRNERSAYLPTVALMGYKDLYTYQLSDMVPDWAVGIGVKVNIFDGFARENKIKSAKLTCDRVQTYQKKTKQDLYTYMTQIYQQMIQAQASYETTLVTLEFSEEYLKIRTKAFKEGMATSTEVNDAQLNLLKVKTENLKSKYEFDVALALLLEMSGESQMFTNYTL